MNHRPRVIITESLDDEAARWLAERAEVHRLAPDDAGFDAVLAQADALVIRTYTRVNPDLLARAPRLNVVGRAGVGVDNVDLAACADRGVRVVYTPDANTRAVIELVLAFILDAIRPRLFLDRALPLDRWKALREELIAERQLAELTVGIMGLGRVGSGVARALAPLAAEVLYHDLLDIPADRRAGARPVPAHELFERADILTVHIDGRPSNRHAVNQSLLARCKPGVLFINTSRGFVVENPALSALLERDLSARAILDVHEPEPFGPDYPILELPNAFLSPHIGAATRLAHRNMSWVVRDVWRVLSGESPQFPAA